MQGIPHRDIELVVGTAGRRRGFTRGVVQLGSALRWDEEVVGSNPATRLP